MTGPNYPPDPVAGSNAIGQFAIGVSQIGDIPTFDIWQTIISQYANSAIITQLIQNFFQYIDQTANLDAFFDLLWNVDTAQGYGLDVWGRIVNVSRTIFVSNNLTYFGFEEATDWDPFGQSSFYDGTALTGNFQLTDAAFRLLIYAKALSNISDGSIRSINQLLLNLFPHRGNCYVIDGQDMTMIYNFNFILSPVELAIVETSGILPKPVGVTASVVQVIG